jgi:hypothetical protein
VLPPVLMFSLADDKTCLASGTTVRDVVRELRLGEVVESNTRPRLKTDRFWS